MSVKQVQEVGATRRRLLSLRNRSASGSQVAPARSPLRTFIVRRPPDNVRLDSLLKEPPLIRVARRGERRQELVVCGPYPDVVIEGDLALTSAAMKHTAAINAKTAGGGNW